jgi:hypothetical protein
MIRRRLRRCGVLVLLLVGATAASCTYLANEFIILDAAGPVAQPPAPPSASQGRW